MGYQEKPIELKFAAVKDLMKGEKVSYVARKYGVDRHMIYEWNIRAESAIKESLKPRKPGPKKIREEIDPHLKVIERLNKLLIAKEEQIKQLEEEIIELQKKARESEIRPPKCNNCGCKKVYKNGGYFVRAKNFFNLLGEDEKMRIPIFICANCGKVVYYDFKKNFLYLLKISDSCLIG